MWEGQLWSLEETGGEQPNPEEEAAGQEEQMAPSRGGWGRVWADLEFA